MTLQMAALRLMEFHNLEYKGFTILNKVNSDYELKIIKYITFNNTYYSIFIVDEKLTILVRKLYCK